MTSIASIKGPRIFAKAKRNVPWPAVRITAPQWQSGQKVINGPDIKEIDFPTEWVMVLVFDIFKEAVWNRKSRKV